MHKLRLCPNHRVCLANRDSCGYPTKIRFSHLFNHLLQKSLHSLSLVRDVAGVYRDHNFYGNSTKNTGFHTKETKDRSVQEKGMIVLNFLNKKKNDKIHNFAQPYGSSAYTIKAFLFSIQYD